MVTFNARTLTTKMLEIVENVKIVEIVEMVEMVETVEMVEIDEMVEIVNIDWNSRVESMCAPRYGHFPLGCCQRSKRPRMGLTHGHPKAAPPPFGRAPHGVQPTMTDSAASLVGVQESSEFRSSTLDVHRLTPNAYNRTLWVLNS